MQVMNVGQLFGARSPNGKWALFEVTVIDGTYGECIEARSHAGTFTATFVNNRLTEVDGKRVESDADLTFFTDPIPPEHSAYHDAIAYMETTYRRKLQ